MRLVNFSQLSIPHLGNLDLLEYHLDWLLQEILSSQWKLGTVFNNLDFCTSTTDDMIIWGEQADGSDHDRHFREFLQTTRNHNQKLSLDRLQLKKTVGFQGTMFTTDGHEPEKEEVQTINKMPQPTNMKYLKYFCIWSVIWTGILQDWQNLVMAWESLPRKMHHSDGNPNILRHMMASREKLPVQPYSDTMTPGSLQLCQNMQACEVLVQSSSKRPTQSNLPAKVSRHFKKNNL